MTEAGVPHSYPIKLSGVAGTSDGLLTISLASIVFLVVGLGLFFMLLKSIQGEVNRGENDHRHDNFPNKQFLLEFIFRMFLNGLSGSGFHRLS